MYGITQVVTSGEAKDVDFASHIPIESTVAVSGIVKKRDEETVNPKLKTGLVEIKIENIEILGKRTANLPFEVNTNQDVREDLRLQYRFLDLRNDKLKNNLILRAKILQFLIGSPLYYKRFGFNETNTYNIKNISEVPDEFVLACELVPETFKNINAEIKIV